jgi:hypothetical protein
MTHPQDSTELLTLAGFPFPVQSSPDLVEHARRLAERFERAYGFLRQTLAVDPQVGLRVLSASDWPVHAHPAFTDYGLTHFDPTQAMVITGGPGSTFWRAFVDAIAAAVPDLLGELQAVYGQADGQIDLARHIETWIVHDLGHACHIRLDYWFPRVWLMEFFADLCLYSYLASNEPAYLPALETLPRVLSRISPDHVRYHTLPDFDAQYIKLDLTNYLWYHGHLFETARKAYAAGGTGVLERLWQTFALANLREVSDAELAGMLQQVQPEIAQMLRGWPA